MTPTRVLVVDGSVVARRMIVDALSTDPSIEVVGTAPNGRIALAKIPRLNPDVVTMEVELPEVDGLETLTTLRASYPTLPVIMFATLTAQGASVRLDALLRGADDHVYKPFDDRSAAGARGRVAEVLIPRIHAFATRSSDGPRSTAPPAPPAVPAGSRRAAKVEAVVVGSSTGGPQALAELLPALHADLPVPVYVVQHMPPTFTARLAARLDATSPLDVREAVDGEAVRAGQIRIAPGGVHLELRREGTEVRTTLTESPPENSCRPAADVLFRTAAEVHGQHALAVVLTGMGSDGRRGSAHVRRRGGQVVVQDEASSVVWGMPGAISAAGLADEVLPLRHIADAIHLRTQVGRAGRGAPEPAVGR